MTDVRSSDAMDDGETLSFSHCLLSNILTTGRQVANCDV